MLRNFIIQRRPNGRAAASIVLTIGLCLVWQLPTAAQEADDEKKPAEIQWTADTDSPRVRAIMQRYAEQSDSERLAEARRLAQFHTAPAVDALCRIARHDRSEVLSKRAALALIENPYPDDTDAGARRTRIEKILEGSDRDAAVWLRTHYADAEPKVAAENWKKLALKENNVLRTKGGETSRDIVQRIHMQLVDSLVAAKSTQQAKGYVQLIVMLQANDPAAMGKLVRWLIDRQAWTSLAALVERYPDTFKTNPTLMYFLAHARRLVDKKDPATDVVREARDFIKTPQQHFVAAYQLQQAGLFEWAKYHYQVCAAPRNGELTTSAITMLSEMLHDQQEDKEAADLLSRAVNSGVFQFKSPKLDTVRCRGYFFRACEYERHGDRKKQAEQLDLAIAKDPNDADVLIALYRLPDQTPEQKKKIADQVRAAMDVFRKKIEEDPESATAYNQFAWLAANTLGLTDRALADEALKHSQKSLELRPGVSGYLDTLAHCHFARGDIDRAVRTQRMAAHADPHTGQIRRALETFERARADRQAKP